MSGDEEKLGFFCIESYCAGSKPRQAYVYYKSLRDHCRKAHGQEVSGRRDKLARFFQYHPDPAKAKNKLYGEPSRQGTSQELDEHDSRTAHKPEHAGKKRKVSAPSQTNSCRSGQSSDDFERNRRSMTLRLQSCSLTQHSAGRLPVLAALLYVTWQGPAVKLTECETNLLPRLQIWQPT